MCAAKKKTDIVQNKYIKKNQKHACIRSYLYVKAKAEPEAVAEAKDKESKTKQRI